MELGRALGKVANMNLIFFLEILCMNHITEEPSFGGPDTPPPLKKKYSLGGHNKRKCCVLFVCFVCFFLCAIVLSVFGFFSRFLKKSHT